MVKLSLVIPCYNESENIPYLLERISNQLSSGAVEVILVDNGSSDDTPNLLKKLLPLHPFIKSLRVEVNRGYGHGILKGLEIARGDILGWTHADMQTDPLDAYFALEKFIEHSQVDIIVKGRRVGRAAIDYFLTLGMQIFASLALGVFLSDINAQPKLFSRNFYNKYFRKDAPADFSIDLFLLYSAKFHGVKIVSVPVTFSSRLYGEAKGGGADIKTRIKIIFRTISFIIKLRRNKLKASNVNN